MGHSVLLAPVLALEPFVRSRWEHYEPAWVSADPAFTHAHVTVLAPFVDVLAAADRDLVAALAASYEPFEVVFDRVGVFAEGTIHAAPEPAGPFSLLTADAVSRWPGHPPYGGAFGDVEDLVPHVTLDHVAGGATASSVRAALAPLLPLRTVIDRLEVHWYDEGGCRVLGSWPLGRHAGPIGSAGSPGGHL